MKVKEGLKGGVKIGGRGEGGGGEVKWCKGLRLQGLQGKGVKGLTLSS